MSCAWSGKAPALSSSGAALPIRVPRVLTMHAPAQTRTMFAGLGVSGSLLGAVAAVVALTSGILSFHAWPVAPPTAPEAALDIAAPARVASRPLALAPVRGSRAARTRPSAVATRPITRTPVRSPTAAPETRTPAARPAPVPTPAPRPAAPPASPAPAVSPPAAVSRVRSVVDAAAGAVAETTAGAATTVGSLGAKTAPPVASVTSTVAAGVAGTGQAVAGLLKGLGGS